MVNAASAIRYQRQSAARTCVSSPSTAQVVPSLSERGLVPRRRRLPPHLHRRRPRAGAGRRADVLRRRRTTRRHPGEARGVDGWVAWWWRGRTTCQGAVTHPTPPMRPACRHAGRLPVGFGTARSARDDDKAPGARRLVQQAGASPAAAALLRRRRAAALLRARSPRPPPMRTRCVGRHPPLAGGGELIAPFAHRGALGRPHGGKCGQVRTVTPWRRQVRCRVRDGVRACVVWCGCGPCSEAIGARGRGFRPRAVDAALRTARRDVCGVDFGFAQAQRGGRARTGTGVREV